jgi:putative endonuclease
MSPNTPADTAPEPTEPAPRPWWLYLLGSARGTTYVGISPDVDRRLAQHNGEQPGGARSTRAGRPWRLLATWGPFTRAEAARHEFVLKRRRGPLRAAYDPGATSVADRDA